MAEIARGVDFVGQRQYLDGYDHFNVQVVMTGEPGSTLASLVSK